MTGGDEDDGGDVEYEKVVENAHGALLSEEGTARATAERSALRARTA
jgi:hypothetical protein